MFVDFTFRWVLKVASSKDNLREVWKKLSLLVCSRTCICSCVHVYDCVLFLCACIYSYWGYKWYRHINMALLYSPDIDCWPLISVVDDAVLLLLTANIVLLLPLPFSDPTPLLSLPLMIPGCYFYGHCWWYAAIAANTGNVMLATAYVITDAILLLPLSLSTLCCYNHWHCWCCAATANDIDVGILLVAMPRLTLCCYYRWYCWRYAVTGRAPAACMMILRIPLLKQCCYWWCHPWGYVATDDATAGGILLLSMPPLTLCRHCC